MHLRVLVPLLLLSIVVSAQVNNPPNGLLYDDAVLPRIDILLSESALETIYDDWFSDYEHPATFIFTHPERIDTIENVGFRLRGSTSRIAAKKSFKVSFNKFTPGKKYQGVEKLNLNGEHADPSIMRSKLAWDILRSMGLPAARVNHVELFINQEYYGLYANVEHIDEEFVDARYGNKYGNLYKCLSPADLTYKGSDADDYANEGYVLKNNLNNYDISDLIEFIDILNNSSNAELACAIDEVLNVQDYLKLMAFDALIGNGDGMYSKNNFYLYYNSKQQLFEFIPYDLDNTLGIDWLGIEWAERNIYDWAPEYENRPLLTRLLEIPEYRNRYSFYIHWIGEEFMGDALLERMQALKSMVSDAALNDEYRALDFGFNDSDFLNADAEGWGDHVPHGLIEFIELRKTSAQEQLEDFAYPPLITEQQFNVPLAGEDVHFRVSVFDDNEISAVGLNYSLNSESFGTLVMEETGEGVYELTVPLEQMDGFYSFNFNATDAVGNTGISNCAMQTIPLNGALKNVRINELMARNTSTIADDHNEFDDWFELYNAGQDSIELSELFVSDDPFWSHKWQLPEGKLAPDEYFLVWADDSPNEGAQHCNFKLSVDGEHIAVYKNSSQEFPPFYLEDQIQFDQQINDESIGLFPNGTGSLESLSFASPGWNNEFQLAIEPVLNHNIQLSSSGNQIHIWNGNEVELDGLFIYNTLGQYIGAKKLSAERAQVVHSKIDKAGIFVLVLRTKAGAFQSTRLYLSE